jgi:hypothetical protein
MADHLERGWHIFQHFGHILSQFAHLTATVGAGARRRVHFFLSRQMFRQGTARRFLDESPHGGRTLGGLCTLILVQLIELKFKLLDLACNLLRGLSELQPFQLGDTGFQLGDLQALRLDLPRQCKHQRFKHSSVIRQMGEIDVHGDNYSPGGCDARLRTLPRVNLPQAYPASSGL